MGRELAVGGAGCLVTCRAVSLELVWPPGLLSLAFRMDNLKTVHQLPPTFRKKKKEKKLFTSFKRQRPFLVSGAQLLQVARGWLWLWARAGAACAPKGWGGWGWRAAGLPRQTDPGEQPHLAWVATPQWSQGQARPQLPARPVCQPKTCNEKNEGQRPPVIQQRSSLQVERDKNPQTSRGLGFSNRGLLNEEEAGPCVAPIFCGQGARRLGRQGLIAHCGLWPAWVPLPVQRQPGDLRGLPLLRRLPKASGPFLAFSCPHTRPVWVWPKGGLTSAWPRKAAESEFVPACANGPDPEHCGHVRLGVTADFLETVRAGTVTSLESLSFVYVSMRKTSVLILEVFPDNPPGN